jgi:hypothetical protein
MGAGVEPWPRKSPGPCGSRIKSGMTGTGLCRTTCAGEGIHYTSEERERTFNPRPRNSHDVKEDDR